MSFSAASQQTLLICGDSLIAGYRIPKGREWVTQIKRAWQELEPPITVINASVNGATISDGYQALLPLFDKYHPGWILIALGTNDGLQSEPFSTIKQDLIQLIRTSKKAEAKPIVIQITMLCDHEQTYNQHFSQIYADIAHQEQIPLIPFFLNNTRTEPLLMHANGIQPSIAAQPLITQWMNQHLLPFLIQQ